MIVIIVAVEQIVGRERRERVSHHNWPGDACVNSRRRVNSTVRQQQVLTTMRHVISTTALILLALSTPAAQTNRRWVLLPETQADHAKQLCSRPGPPKFQGTWKPTDSDIQAMESHLSRISLLPGKSGRIRIQVKHPDRYYRQYLGIVIDGRNFIYINAFCGYNPS